MLKFKDIAEIHLVLNEMVNRDNEYAKDNEGQGFLPYQTKLKVATVARKIGPDFEQYSKERFELFKKLGEPVYKKRVVDGKATDENTEEIESYSIPNDVSKMAEFTKLFNELTDTEADLEKIKELKQSDLGDPCPLNVNFIMSLQAVGLLEKLDE